MSRIRVALAGVGNCAASLVQGIHYYRKEGREDGLIHGVLGGYAVSDIEVATAFDVDVRKIGRDLHEAIFAPPNSARTFFPDLPPSGVAVKAGRLLDGEAEHLKHYPEKARLVASRDESDAATIVDQLRRDKIEVLVNYLPVGSTAATHFYAECAIEAGVAFVNCIPVFIASDPEWNEKFRQAGLPLIGDDIKSQFGATILHRNLAETAVSRGIEISKTYQVNLGGNSDFLNMLSQQRLTDKRTSKTEAVRSSADGTIPPDDIFVGPSDHISFLKDEKHCFIEFWGKGFAGQPVRLSLKLQVEDSPNSAAVVVDAIRFAKMGLERRQSGALEIPSACCCKSPPRQIREDRIQGEIEEFLRNHEKEPTPKN